MTCSRAFIRSLNRPQRRRERSRLALLVQMLGLKVDQVALLVEKRRDRCVHTAAARAAPQR